MTTIIHRAAAWLTPGKGALSVLIPALVPLAPVPILLAFAGGPTWRDQVILLCSSASVGVAASLGRRLGRRTATNADIERRALGEVADKLAKDAELRRDRPVVADQYRMAAARLRHAALQREHPTTDETE